MDSLSSLGLKLWWRSVRSGSLFKNKSINHTVYLFLLNFHISLKAARLSRYIFFLICLKKFNFIAGLVEKYFFLFHNISQTSQIHHHMTLGFYPERLTISQGFICLNFPEIQFNAKANISLKSQRLARLKL